ncbi:alpha/beta hydrolase [Halopseudomonas salegens]|uniref:Acetyl esterase/lipase n=1 Tax=Halopseudomonas salegens TaxID=1434072 RepID=A0A1H2E4R8_9GAMM|nr:alpha/beta hydrolase [Halopseudomonas salegens]SDT90212.1 Acetyl esterase/lipase [Halopseudomonas salegens]
MIDGQIEHTLAPKPSRFLYTAIGYALRVAKQLPAPLRERLLSLTTGSLSGDIPPFRDVLQLIETAGGIPDGRLWQQKLLEDRPGLSGVRVHDVIGANSEWTKARLYLPPEDAPKASAAFVWIHGGAFVMGSLDAREAHWPSIELAAAGIPVLSVDYRMCLDGVHYPAPQDDVFSAWEWAVKHFRQFGIKAPHFHLGGGSAGACLAASLALRLRDEQRVQPASLYLAYPVLEGNLPPSSTEMEKDLAIAQTLPGDWIAEMFANWAGTASWDEPYVSPALASLSGLPPTYVMTCGRDILRRSSEPYVERLRMSGVEVWHDVFAESEHAPLDRPETDDGKLAIERLRQWLTSGTSGMV